jgi:hypothetical protein
VLCCTSPLLVQGWCVGCCPAAPVVERATAACELAGAALPVVCDVCDSMSTGWEWLCDLQLSERLLGGFERCIAGGGGSGGNGPGLRQTASFSGGVCRAQSALVRKRMQDCEKKLAAVCWKSQAGFILLMNSAEFELWAFCRGSKTQCVSCLFWFLCWQPTDFLSGWMVHASRGLS